MNAIIIGALTGTLASSMVVLLWGIGNNNYNCDVRSPASSNYNSTTIAAASTDDDCDAVLLEAFLRTTGMFLVMPLGAVIGGYFTGAVIAYTNIAGNVLVNAPSRFARWGLYDSPSESTMYALSAHANSAAFNV